MNLTPTELDRLTIFSAAELARRYRSLGIRLSRPEAVALICDEVLTAARRDMPYEEIRDLAGRLLSTDDVMPGVMEMTPLICIEAGFAEGTKLIAIFDPIRPGDDTGLSAADDALVPGEIITPDEDLELFAGADAVSLDVINTGDRDIQVRSHAHFFETNRALNFDRAASWGRKLDVAAGAGVRFEPGIPKQVRLVPIQGLRVVVGQAGLVNGALDAPGVRDAALARAQAGRYRGA
jgi:urease subunit gamma/beta